MRYQLTDADRQKSHDVQAAEGRGNDGAAIINTIRRRTKCGTKCMLFDRCPLMPLSISAANKGRTCLLNVGGAVMIRRYLNLIAKGEDGIINEINNTLYLYAQDIETASPKVKKEYALMCMQLHKQLYVDRPAGKLEERPQLTVVINELGRKEAIVPIVDVTPLNQASQRETNKLAYRIVKAEKEEDPESLINSPVVDQVMKDLPNIYPNLCKPSSAESRNTEQDPETGKFRRKTSVQKPHSNTENDEPEGTSSQPEELAQAPESTAGRTDGSTE